VTASSLVSLRVYAIWVGRMSSLGANVYHCVTRFGQDIDSILHLTPAATDQCFGVPSPNDVDRANRLVELLLLRSGVLTFSSSGFSSKEVNSIVENVACYCFFLLFLLFLLFLFYVCTPCTISY